MAAMINAGVVGVVEETVAEGADPTKARTWWLGEISRVANEREVEVVEMPITQKMLPKLLL